MMIAAVGFFSSCSNDSDDSSSSSSSQSSQTGETTGKTYTTVAGGTYVWSQYGQQLSWTFNENKTALMNNNECGTWTENNKTVTITCDGLLIATFKADSTFTTLTKDGLTYTRK